MFSLFAEDSVPKKKLVVKKNRHGIIVKIRYLKKIESFRTVKMENIYPEDTSVWARAGQDVAYDSLSGDLKTKVLNKYNTEQVKYMELIGNQLLDAREKQMAAYEKQLKVPKEAQLQEGEMEEIRKPRQGRRKENRQFKKGQDAVPPEKAEKQEDL